VTVIDTSAVVDFLLGVGVAADVERLMQDEGELAAPDVLVLETLAVMRREVLRGGLAEQRAAGAVNDLGELPVELFPSLVLRGRAWELRNNLTAADALFVALAEALAEPIATKDGALADAAARHSTATALTLA
jgi:predicted nucleic acid-binding protein